MRVIGLALLLIVIAVPALPAQAQTAAADSSRFFDVTIGLGAGAHFASPIADYINQIAQPLPGQKAELVTSAPEFFASADLQISDDWSVGIEYGLLVKSYAMEDRSGLTRTNFSYEVHMPSMVVCRLVTGEGYRLKAGGGIGYHFSSFRQEVQPFGSNDLLRASGPGFKLEAVGNTKFDESFYGSIGLDLRWDFLGRLKYDNEAPSSGRVVEPPSMEFFNAGIKFGITFQLN